MALPLPGEVAGEINEDDITEWIALHNLGTIRNKNKEVVNLHEELLAYGFDTIESLRQTASNPAEMKELCDALGLVFNWKRRFEEAMRSLVERSVVNEQPVPIGNSDEKKEFEEVDVAIEGLSLDAVRVVPGSYKMKCIILGDVFVGKSCLLCRFVRNSFMESYESTIGASFLAKTIRMDSVARDGRDLNDVEVKMEMWDTAGQERYRSLAPMYYRGAQLAIFVFDVANAETLGGAQNWIQTIKEFYARNPPEPAMILVGNKTDLVDQRQIGTDEGAQMAAEYGIMYRETSAKTGENVNEMFVYAAERAIRMMARQNLERQQSDDVVIVEPAPRRVCCG